MDRQVYMANGMADYLAKPFTEQTLWAVLLKYLMPVRRGALPAARATDSGRSSFPAGKAIDTELGLRLADSSQALFQRLRHKFAADNRNGLARLCRLLAAERTAEAIRLAHTLKGSAILLGATMLADAAAQVEQALAAHAPEAAREERMRVLEENLAAVLEELAADAPVAVEPVTAAPGTLDREKALLLVDALLPLVKVGDRECLRHTDVILEALAPVGSKCSALVAQISDCEFAEAVETLMEIRQLLEDWDQSS